MTNFYLVLGYLSQFQAIDLHGSQGAYYMILPGLTVVHHNSGELFHLQVAGHFSFQNSQEMKIAHFKNHGLMMRTKVLLLENNVSM